jgi:hypothetical protein
MAKKEACPRCQNEKFAIAKDKSNKHYCQTKGCMHVWVPGLEGMKRPDVVLKQAQVENQSLLAEVTKLRKENADLKSKLAQHESAKKANKPAAEDEIFS